MRNFAKCLGTLCGIAIILGCLNSTSRANSTINLAWNPSVDPNIAGYRVYSGTASGVYTQETDVGNVTYASIGNLASGENYFFVVTAYDTSDVESIPSAEVSAPTPGVILATGSSSATIAWNASEDPNIATYRIYWGTSSGVYTQQMNVGNVVAAAVGNLNAGETYYFAVTAIDTAGLESILSAEVSTQTASGVTDGMSFNTSTPISLDAIASEGGGSIASVNFYLGSTPITTSNAGSNIGGGSAPYGFTLNGLSAGSHEITVVATDSNGSSTSTEITINVVPFGITSMQLRPDNSLQLTVTGATGKTNSLYYSTNMQNWTFLTSAVNTNGTLMFDDPGAVGSSRRYYQVLSN
jgi:hypothetical protein